MKDMIPLKYAPTVRPEMGAAAQNISPPLDGKRTELTVYESIRRRFSPILLPALASRHGTTNDECLHLIYGVAFALETKNQKPKKLIELGIVPLFLAREKNNIIWNRTSSRCYRYGDPGARLAYIPTHTRTHARKSTPP